MQTEIARFLAEKAVRQTRATYQQVVDAVGWSHPTGQGPGKNLEIILHDLHDRGLPPLAPVHGFAEMRPGNTIGSVHRAVSDTYRKHGLDAYLRKSYGYATGICYPPTWVSQPMIIQDSPVVIEENMTLFLHLSLTDAESGIRVSSGETVRVQRDRVEKLINAPKELILN